MVEITASVVGLEETEDRLEAIPEVVGQRIRNALNQIGSDFATYVRDVKLSGGVLNPRSGKLRSSITYTMQGGGTMQYVDVTSQGVPYAKIHEYGGIVNIPEIQPKNARALHFVSGGADIYAARTQAHAVTIPERSFMRSTTDEQRQPITDRLSSAVQNLWG